MSKKIRFTRVVSVEPSDTQGYVECVCSPPSSAEARSHGSPVYPQQPGITLHYMEHNDSQKRMIIGLTGGFSSLTHCFCECVFMLLILVLEYFMMTQLFLLFRLKSDSL